MSDRTPTSRLRFVSLHSRVDVASIVLMAFSLFGFLGNVMLDYNWGTNPITNSFAIIYSSTLRQIIPFPLGYYGVGAGIYLGLFLSSFLLLNRREPLRVNVLETIGLASAVIVLFELGLYYFVPYFMNVWVIDAVKDTPLRYFTNTDLLALSAAAFILSQLMVRKVKTQLIRPH
jgi:hypothetical protein